MVAKKKTKSKRTNRKASGREAKKTKRETPRRVGPATVASVGFLDFEYLDEVGSATHVDIEIRSWQMDKGGSRKIVTKSRRIAVKKGQGVFEPSARGKKKDADTIANVYEVAFHPKIVLSSGYELPIGSPVVCRRSRLHYLTRVLAKTIGQKVVRNVIFLHEEERASTAPKERRPASKFQSLEVNFSDVNYHDFVGGATSATFTFESGTSGTQSAQESVDSSGNAGASFAITDVYVVKFIPYVGGSLHGDPATETAPEGQYYVRAWGRSTTDAGGNIVNEIHRRVLQSE